MPVFGGVFGVAGGQNLGTARGAVVIDTSQAQNAANTMRRVGQDMSRSFAGVQSTILSLRRELTLLSAAAGAVTGFGLMSARDLRNYRVQFSQLLGDYGKADRLMVSLTDQANKFGIEVTEVWQLGRALIPVLKDGADQLDTWVKRAALLASTNPLKGTVDAVRAIQEYLAGQTRSLQFLFNVDPNLIQEAQRQYQDVGQQLDYILTRLGATEAGALAMADAWVAVRNELKLTLATAFTPLLQELQPILRNLADFLARLRETNPELLTFGAGLASVAAVGAPLLLFLSSVIKSLQTIKALSIAPALGKLGLAGLAIGGGVALGGVAARGIGQATGNEQLSKFQVADAWETLKQALLVAADTVLKVFTSMNLAAGLWVKGAVDAVAALRETIGRFVQFIGSILPARAGGNLLEEAGQKLIDGAEALRTSSQEGLKAFTDELVRKYDENLQAIGHRLFPELISGASQPVSGGGFGGPGTSAPGAAAAGGPTEDMVTAFREYLMEVRDVERDAAKERVAIVEEYDAQIVQTEAEYGQRRTDAVEAFAQQQAEAAADFAYTWQRTMRDFIASERQIEEDYYRQRAERAAAFGVEVQRAEEDHQREMRRMREDSEARQYDLIARRDALGLVRERRSYEVNRQRAEEDYQVQASRRSEDFARQMAEMDMQFAAARDRRLADFEQRRADAEEDFQRRRERELSHQQQTLAELDTALTDQKDLLLQRKDEELTAVDTNTKEHLGSLEEEMARRIHGIDATMLTSYWAVQYAELNTINVTKRLIEWIDRLNGTHWPSVPGMATGGYATSGIYRLGEVGREFVLNADTTRAAETMARGSLDQQAIRGMLAGGGGRSSGQIVYQDRREFRFYGSLTNEERARIRDENRADMARQFNMILAGAG